MISFVCHLHPKWLNKFRKSWTSYVITLWHVEITPNMLIAIRGGHLSCLSAGSHTCVRMSLPASVSSVCACATCMYSFVFALCSRVSFGGHMPKCLGSMQGGTTSRASRASRLGRWLQRLGHTRGKPVEICERTWKWFGNDSEMIWDLQCFKLKLFQTSQTSPKHCVYPEQATKAK